MDLNAMVTIWSLWVFGLAIAYKFAQLGYPWLAIVVLLLLGSIRMKWGGEESDEEE
jgi:hypothetical protein